MPRRSGSRSGLRVIGRGAFCGCTSLKGVRLPDSLEEIGLDAFRESGLEDFVAPRSLRTVRQGAFWECRQLRRARLNEGLEALGTDEYPPEREGARCYTGVFGRSALESISLPSTLKRIEYGAFEGCGGLASVQLPGRLERIGKRCFCWCALEEVSFPASVEEVQELAFYGNQLRRIAFRAGSRLKFVGDHAFGKNGQLQDVRFPEGARVSEKAFQNI